ncbi:MAG: hypothetical protein ACQER7_11170 [Bacteroidota bacterium]
MWLLKKISSFTYFIITLISSIVGIFLFSTLFFPELNKQGWVGVLFLGALALIFLGYNVYLYIVYSKKSRYAGVFEEINLGFSELHKASRNESDSYEIMRSIENLCDYISSSFKEVYGHRVRTTIKILETDTYNGRVKATTLQRDKKSKSMGAKTGLNDKIPHWIDENSDFSNIYSTIEDNISLDAFHKTRLPFRKKYRNTRLQERKDWPPKHWFFWLTLLRE